MNAIQDAVKASIAGNYWTQLGKKTAPKGKFRLVHIDPRDHEVTVRGDFDDVAKVKTVLGGMIYAEREVMAVYDDRGQCVPL